MSSSEQTLRLSSSNLPLIPRSSQIPTFSHNATFLSRSTQYCTAHLLPTTQFAASWPVKRRMLWDSRDGEYKWTWITFCSCGEIGAESREKIKTAEWYYWAGETGGGLDRRKTNVASFMINFIHSVYRQELKLKKRNHFTTLFLYYFFTYLFWSLWLIYRSCPHLRLNGAQSFYWRGFGSKRRRFHVRYHPSLCRAFGTETKQDRQCRYDVTLRCVRETIVVMEKKTISITYCVCFVWP